MENPDCCSEKSNIDLYFITTKKLKESTINESVTSATRDVFLES